MIKVSVVMPAYNVEEYIEKSIESVMNQTLEEIELIVINDASTDGTWEKITLISEKYGSKIRGINLEKNLRQGGARNIGIKEARGEYIAFVDSDDWIEPDMLEKFYNAAKECDADLAGTDKFYKFWADGTVKEFSRGNVAVMREISGKVADQSIREKYFLCMPGLWRNIWKKEVIVKNNVWFPEGVSYEDNYFSALYVAYAKKYAYVDGFFYHYRQNDTSTFYRKDSTQLQRIEVEKILLSEFKRRGLYDDLKEVYEINAIKRWYITTLGIFYGRLGKDAIKYSKEMGREFRSIFPKYRKNKYYKSEISKKNRIKVRIFEFSPRLLYLLYAIKSTKQWYD